MQLIDEVPNTDFIFGLGGNANLLHSAEPTLKQARALYAQRQAFGNRSAPRLYEASNSALGLATHTSASTYEELYSGRWVHLQYNWQETG